MVWAYSRKVLVRNLWLALGFFLAVLPIHSAVAVEFKLGETGISGAFDSTLSYGLSVRVGSPKNVLAGSGGNPNFDSGDLISHVVKGSHDLELNFGARAGAFFRGLYYYDDANADLPLRDAAQDKAISDLALLDAYGYIRFGAEDQFMLRYGKQVISWGENTFIQGSLNDINPVDVSKLRTPGSELKEAFLPTHSVYGSWSINPAWTIEAFYLLEFDEVELDSAGTFFDTSSFVNDGGYRLGPIARASDNPARDGGQYGVALRYFAAGLFDGVEFGAYYMNLHSRIPLVSVIAPDFPLNFAPPAPAAPASPPPAPLGTAQYFLDYPEDIEMWGLSFNTYVAGWAFAGEWSHRRNAPIQLNFGDEAVGFPSALTDFAFPAPRQAIRAWDRIRVDQVQFTLQRLWGPNFGADQVNTIGEVAYNWVGDEPADPLFIDITDDSWGYQFRVSLDYNRSLFNIVNLSPFLAFRHDVDGTSSEGPPLFLDHRKALTLGVNWSYLIKLTGGISYTSNFGGDSKTNAAGSLIHNSVDRDFLSVNVSYQF